MAELRSTLLAAELTDLDATGRRLWGEQDVAKAEQRALADEREALIEERARAGGNRIGDLERLIREARAEAGKRRDNRVLFDAAVAAAGFAPVSDQHGFAALATSAAELRARLAELKRSLDVAGNEAIGREKELERRRDGIAAELTSLEQRTSNPPVEQVEVQAQLCADLGLTPDDLPYAGELLDVRTARRMAGSLPSG